MLLLAAQLLPVDFSCKLDDETPHPTVYLDHGHCLTLGQKDSLRLEHVMYDHLHIGLLSQHHCAPPCLMSLLDTCSFVKTCCLSRHNQVVHRVCSLRAILSPQNAIFAHLHPALQEGVSMPIRAHHHHRAWTWSEE